MNGPWLQFPEWADTIALVIGAAAAILLASRLRARRRGRRLLGPWAPGPRGDLLPWLALLALGIALVGPRIGTRAEPSTALGADVVLLFDTSRSMTAGDNPPSRLHRARRAALELIAQLGAGDRVALATFSGDGVLLTPLSRDLRALAELVPLVDDTLVGRAGSNLADGMRAALGAFAAERPRVLVLLSDGEDPLRRGVAGPAAEAARSGTRVVSLGFGSEDGSSIPDGDASLRDRNGREVVSRRNGEALARLAEMTDGAFFAADRWGEVDVEAILVAVHRDVAPAAGETVERRVAAVRVAPFAAFAFALLALDTLGGLARRRAPVLALGAAALTLMGSASPEERALESHLRARPEDARALVELGIARAERGRSAEARRAFAAAALRARAPEVAATALFDLGVTALEQNDLEGARDAFFDAAALQPGDRRTQYNLEWTLAALASRPPPPASARPQPDPDAESRPRPQPQPAEASSDPRPLTAEEARRWLQSVEDDARRGLRSAGQRAPSPLRPSREPGW